MAAASAGEKKKEASGGPSCLIRRGSTSGKQQQLFALAVCCAACSITRCRRGVTSPYIVRRPSGEMTEGRVSAGVCLLSAERLRRADVQPQRMFWGQNGGEQCSGKD